MRLKRLSLVAALCAVGCGAGADTAPSEAPLVSGERVGTPRTSSRLAPPLALTWTVEHAPDLVSLRAVWGAGGDVYAVGDRGRVLRSRGGAPWLPVDVGGGDDNLTSVWGTGADDVHVVGGPGWIHSSDGGSTWQRRDVVASGSKQIIVSGAKQVIGTSPSDFYLGSEHTTDGGETFVDVPGGYGAEGVFLYPVGASVVSFQNRQWDSYSWKGSPPMLFASSDGFATYRSMVIMLPNLANLCGAWGASPTRFFVVTCDDEHLVRYDGASLTVVSIGKDPLARGFRALHGVGRRAWLVGDGGLIRQSEDAGDTWRVIDPSPTDRALEAVFAVGPTDVYAVGDGGVIVHGHL